MQAITSLGIQKLSIGPSNARIFVTEEIIMLTGKSKFASLTT
jgi:hypothetical protein